MLLATTGMRRGEALGLRRGDVDLAAGRLSIGQTITPVREQMVISPPKTSRSRRSASLDPVTVAALGDHRRRQNEERLRAGEAWSNTSDLVFTNEVGEPVHPSACWGPPHTSRHEVTRMARSHKDVMAARRARLSHAAKSQRGVSDQADDIAVQVIELSERHGLTRAELAERCGIDQADISRIERGSTSPTVRTLRRWTWTSAC